jgi:hypothetical protein
MSTNKSVTFYARRWSVDCVLLLILTLVSTQLHGSELKHVHNTSDLTNIGFMENPPKELKEKFPMCDAFLKVEWIDKEKKIGYSRYDIYNRFGKKEERPVAALVHLDQDRPYFDIDVDEYRDKMQLQSLFLRIRQGEIVPGNTFLTIRYKHRNEYKYIELTSVNGIRDIGGISLSDHRKTVCIPYPDNNRMWIAEGRRLDKVYNDEEIVNIVLRMTTYIPQFSRSWGKYSYIIDVNFDGVDDYAVGGILAYSYGDKYYEMQPLWAHEGDENYGHWSIPPTQKTCEIYLPAGTYLATDGQNYFLNNQCNLTKLTKAGE